MKSSVEIDSVQRSAIVGNTAARMTFAIFAVCFFIGVMSLLPMGSRNSTPQPQPVDWAKLSCDCPTLAPGRVSSPSSSGAGAPQQQQQQQRAFVDPHPSDPAVNGKSPAYTGPSRETLRAQLGYCTFYKKSLLRKGSEIERAMLENPDFVAPLPVPRTRNEIASLLQCEEKKVGVELGVQWGGFARHHLALWPAASEYWLCDLWAQQENYIDAANVNNKKQQRIFETAINKLRHWKEKVKVCRNFTTVCAERFQDSSVDYIYVDARHDRAGVLEDLKAWWPKLKRGGIMAGHDFIDHGHLDVKQNWLVNFDGSVDQTGMLVRGAVEDFFMSEGALGTGHYRQVVVTTQEGHPYATWLVRK